MTEQAMAHPAHHRGCWRRRAVAIALAALASGCGGGVGAKQTTDLTGEPPPPGPCTANCVDREWGDPDADGVLGAGPVTVSLLVRSFLPRTVPEDDRYVFHNYLFFADNRPDTRSKRLAAAAAVLELFSHAEAAYAVGVDTTRLAALHVPVCSPAAADWVMAEPPAQGQPLPRPPRCVRDGVAPDASRAAWLDAAYDLQRSGLIQRRIEAAIGRPLPRVALIGYPSPIGSDAAIDLEQLYVVDLACLPADEVTAAVSVFQRALESAAGLDSAYPDAAEQNRRAYETLARPDCE